MSDDFEVIKKLGQDGAQGVVYLVEFNNGLRAAMKQFKSTKSPARIQAEADLQSAAADAGIAPEVMHVDLEKKRIFMEPMQCRLVDVLKTSNKRFEEDLYHIMQTLDKIDILHNDGNALNLMLNVNDELQIIDFGLSKKIDKKLRKKWGEFPNKKVTLFMMKKELKKYNIHINNTGQSF
jgi:tRNA A-37 threonylcarbamoyl transferase component Bud32